MFWNKLENHVSSISLVYWIIFFLWENFLFYVYFFLLLKILRYFLSSSYFFHLFYSSLFCLFFLSFIPLPILFLSYIFPSFPLPSFLLFLLFIRYQIKENHFYLIATQYTYFCINGLQCDVYRDCLCVQIERMIPRWTKSKIDA